MLLTRYFAICLLLVLTAVEIPSSLVGQDFAYRQYGTEHGLPSSEVYQIIQDREGMMWFATDEGVSRFDGYTFQTFTVRHGLPDKVVFGFSLDQQGRVWVYTLSRKLAYFEDGQFHQPAINGLIEQIPVSFGNIARISIHAIDDIYLGFTHGPSYHLKNNQVTLLEQVPAEAKVIAINTLPNDQLILGYFSADRESTQSLELMVDGTLIPYPVSPAAKAYYYNVIRNHRREILVSNGRELIRIQDKKLVQFRQLEQQETTLYIFSDQQNNLWASTVRQGIRCFPNGDLSQEPATYLPGLSVSSICQDHEGNYWFSTLEDGVFFITGFTFVQLQSRLARQQRVNCILPQGNELYLGMKSGEVLQMNLLTGQEIKLRAGNEVRSLSRFSGGGIIASHFGISTTPTTLFRKDQIRQELSQPLAYFHTQKDRCWLVIGKEMHTSSTDNPWDSKRLFEIQAKLNCFHLDSGDTLWLGTHLGLQKYSEATGLVDLSSQHPFLNGSIRAVVEYPNLPAKLLAIKNIGLVWLQGDSVTKINLPTQWEDTSFERLRIGKSGEIWVGSNQGLFRFWPGKSTAAIDLWEHYGTAHGLPSNEIHDLQLQGDTVFLATSKGVAYFNSKQLYPSTLRPILYLRNVNGHPHAPGETLTFPADSNNIAFEFFGLNYRHAGNLEYEYRLLGAEEEWIKTKALEVRYAGLAPGVYTFQLRNSVNDDLLATDQLITQQIEILPPLWKRNWFIVASIVAAFLLVYYLFHRRGEVLRKEYELKQALNESEQKALRAQMNPHFIFNALNSIQKFILNSDQRAAQKYLSIFSRIIRQYLNHSERDFIPLNEEIELLEHYVALESLRLDHPLNLDIQIESPLNAYTVEIPPMLIQPFIENAIWHGLLPKEGAGKIVVVFKPLSEQKIQCEVRDNGVGIPNDILTQKPNGKPSGIKITGKRVKLLWEKAKVEESIHFKQLKDEGGKPAGTAVNFTIPIQF